MTWEMSFLMGLCWFCFFANIYIFKKNNRLRSQNCRAMKTLPQSFYFTNEKSLGTERSLRNLQNLEWIICHGSTIGRKFQVSWLQSVLLLHIMLPFCGKYNWSALNEIDFFNNNWENNLYRRENKWVLILSAFG